MEEYALTHACRRGFVLRYFGDPAAMERCTDCDNCVGGAGYGPAFAQRLRRLRSRLGRQFPERP
jgi:superfamily II DNA helicase RecQ